jgi:RNA polymerase sigma factor (sigma-70 family)
VLSVDVVGGRDRGVGRASAVTAAQDEAPIASPFARVAPRSFEDFYQLEFPRIRAFARVLSGSVGSDDLAQEAMLVAYRRWREVSTMADPAMWVRRVCVHLATSLLRRRAVEARAVLRLGARPSHPIVLDEDDDAFWSAVRALPRRQAQVVALYYLYDLPVAEVAATLEMSDGTVKTHLSRARKSLATFFDPAGGELS